MNIDAQKGEVRKLPEHFIGDCKNPSLPLIGDALLMNAAKRQRQRTASRYFLNYTKEKWI